MLQVEHSAILSTFSKLPFVIKIFVLSIFELPFYTGFTEATKFYFSYSKTCVERLLSKKTENWFSKPIIT